MFSYAGNANREGDGATFYTYVDEPGTTTKETTQFSYNGDAYRPNFAPTNRFQFMGNVGA
jgi:hypothetical protein